MDDKERRFRLSGEDRAVILNALGMYLDHLEKEKAKIEAKETKGRGEYAFYYLVRTAETVAWVLGTSENPLGGRRRSWTHDEVNGEWCRKRALLLNPPKAAT